MDKRYWIIGAVIVLVIVVLGITLSSSKNISGKGSLASGGVFSKCSDSDGGLSYNVYGEVTSGSKKYQDACSGNILSEKYCKNNRPSSKDYNCPIVCYTGACCTPKTCSDLGKSCGTWDDGCGGTLNCGTCSNGQTCSNGNCITDLTCSDSDGGIVFNVKGTTTKGAVSVTDSCDSNYVMEYYCLDNNIANINATCVTNTTTNCASGACV